MNWIVITAIIIFFVLLILFLTPVRVQVFFTYQEKNQDLAVKITLWHIFKKNITIPMLEIDEETSSVIVKEKTSSSVSGPEEKTVEETPEEIKQQMKTMKMWLQHIQNALPTVRSFLEKVKVREMRWHTRYGLSDAALTGMAAGVIWTLKMSVAATASKILDLTCKPEFSVQPEFQNKGLEMLFSCIISFRLGQAIHAGIRLLRHMNGNIIKLLRQSMPDNHSKEAS
ncbi:DUF2953 domain-containing protein [Alteribacillus sp. HJP-4]|uniref:DUF2953 domain-containing protein n=1 Tax=Alteribacillus sp. HJP-4 TaxID=2775394 RepID=UPI0035CCEEC2